MNKNKNVAITMLIIIGVYVLMLKKSTEDKRKILITLLPLSLIAVFSPAFLFIILLPIFILLLLKTSNQFDPYFFTNIVNNMGASISKNQLPITDEDKKMYSEGKTDIPSYSYVENKHSNSNLNSNGKPITQMTADDVQKAINSADISTQSKYDLFDIILGGGWLWKK